jgi:hypothetical protein
MTRPRKLAYRLRNCVVRWRINLSKFEKDDAARQVRSDVLVT